MSMMCEAQQETSTGATYMVQDSVNMEQCARCNVQCGWYTICTNFAQILHNNQARSRRTSFQVLNLNGSPLTFIFLLVKISQFATYLA